MLSKNERLVMLIKYFGKENNSEFARFLGVSPQTISSWLSRNTFDVDLIYAKCSDISADWLLGGNGDMLRDADGDPSQSQTEPTIIYKSDPLKDEIIALQRDKIKLLEEKLYSKEDILRPLDAGLGFVPCPDTVVGENDPILSPNVTGEISHRKRQ